jgi:hypothetical protein
MPKAGIEPARPFGHRILSPARLPVPPLRLGPEAYVNPSDPRTIMSEMANRDNRAGVRVEHEMPLRWYSAPDPGAEASAHDGMTVDVSAVGAAFITASAPAVDETVVVHLKSESPALDVATPARVVRVTRAVGGYRCAVQFVPINPAHRATLGKFVFALIRDRAA